MVTIEEILREAKAAGASDVHLTVGIPPKMRVNGDLITMKYDRMLPADTMDVLISVMSQTQMERFEERGEYDFSFSIPNCGRYRVNAYKQRGSVAIAFRIVGTKVPSPEELGLPESVADLGRRSRGLILVTGPAGSGKSTTLAAIIDRINHYRDAHVITLEDPIEYLHQHKMSMVNQREIGLDSGNYASGLRAALREDPDVILVGEMRDCETISLAVAAAETGHLVLSSLHTVGAVNTIDRLIDVFPAHSQQQIRVQLSNVLEAVVSQQLIPRADGKGRAAAFEILHTNHAVRNLIREGRADQLASVMQTDGKLGMICMDEFIMQLYRDGKIDRECAVRFALDPDSMEAALGAGGRSQKTGIN